MADTRTPNFDHTPVDVQRLQTLIGDAFEKVSEVQGKEIVLVVGNTGSGKSTSVDYCLGCEMEERIDELGNSYPYPKGKVFAKIGIGGQALTEYPEVFTLPDQGISFCDTPGFFDNRGKVKDICTFVSIQIAIRFAQKIKAMVVVVEYGSLTEGRGKGIRDLTKILGKLLRDPSAIKNSIIIGFTKVPPHVTREAILRSVTGICDNYIEQHADLGQRLLNVGRTSPAYEELEELEQRIFALELIKRSGDNLIFIKPLDGGRSKNELLNRVRLSRGIAQQYFYQYNPPEFENLLGAIALRGLVCLQDKIALPRQVNFNNEQIEELKLQDEYYERQIENLKHPENQVDFRAEQIEFVKKEIDARQVQRAICEEKKNAYTRTIDQLRRKVAVLDTDDLETYWQDNFEENRSTFYSIIANIVGRQSSKTFVYDRRLPFSNVILRGDGEFRNEEKDAANGIFKTTYVSHPGEVGSASVTIQLQRRHHPDYVQQIENLSRILRNTLERNKLNDEILGEHTARLLQFQQILGNLEHDKTINRVVSEQMRTEIIAARRKATEDAERFEKENVQLNGAIRENELIYSTNLQLFKMLQKLAEIMKFRSEFVDQFLVLFDQYLKEEYVRDITEEIPTYFKDNVFTHTLLFRPVLTSCGHTFEEMNIKEYIRTRGVLRNHEKEVDCPCCRKTISNAKLYPEKNLREAIEDWRNKIFQKRNPDHQRFAEQGSSDVHRFAAALALPVPASSPQRSISEQPFPGSSASLSSSSSSALFASASAGSAAQAAAWSEDTEEPDDQMVCVV